MDAALAEDDDCSPRLSASITTAHSLNAALTLVRPRPRRRRCTGTCTGCRRDPAGRTRLCAGSTVRQCALGAVTEAGAQGFLVRIGFVHVGLHPVADLSVGNGFDHLDSVSGATPRLTATQVEPFVQVVRLVILEVGRLRAGGSCRRGGAGAPSRPSSRTGFVDRLCRSFSARKR